MRSHRPYDRYYWRNAQDSEKCIVVFRHVEGSHCVGDGVDNGGLQQRHEARDGCAACL